MQETRMVKAIHSWKPISKGPTGRPKTRWDDDVRKDIQEPEVSDWKALVQDRRRWKELVEKAKTLHTEYFFRTNFNAHFTMDMYVTLSSTCFGP